MSNDKRSRKELLAELDELRRGLVESSQAERDLVTAQDLIWRLDTEGRVVYLNEAWSRHGAFDVAAMLGRKFTDMQPPDTAARDHRVFLDNLKGGSVFDYETVLLSTSGQPVYLLVNAVATRDTSGRVTGTHGTAVDITARVQLEERLRDSERRYKAQWEELDQVYRTAPVGLCLIDPEFKFVHINQVLARMNGVPIDDHIGRTVDEIIPDFAAGVIDAIEEVLESGAPVENVELSGRTAASLDESRHYIGNYYPVRAADGTITGVSLVVADITERKAAEESLRQSEDRYRSLVDNSADLIWRITTDGVITYISPSVKDLMGFEPEELIGRRLSTESAFGKHANEILEKRRRGDFGTGSIVYEMALPRADGSTFMAEMRSSPVIGPDGGFTEMQGIARDITERTKAEAQLQAARHQNELILNATGEGIYGLDLDCTTTFINPAAERMLGWSAADLIGKNPHGIIRHSRADGTPFPIEECLIHSAMMGGSSRHVDNEVFWRADGTPFQVDYIASPMYDQDGNLAGAVVSFRDITERRRMEEELLKVQKLESIGVLAGGIAHDLNNYLTTIMGNMGMARISEDRKERDAYLDETEHAFVRVRDLTDQLLTFAKGGTPVLKPGSLGALIRDTTVFALRGTNCTPTFTLPDDLWSGLVDQGQINQVISNLVINAQQAMPNGGNVDICAENLSLDGGSSLPLAKGRYIKVSVSDSGHGIPATIQGRIFDPFFTTKAAGNGLGLATAYSIVRNHEGHIGVASTPRGTTFSLYLPASDGQPEPEEKEPLVSGRADAGGAILVMDDSEDIRKMAEHMLAKIGFSVVTSEHGEDAISAYTEAIAQGTPFEAVILDLTVAGGMGGKDAIAKLRAIDPDVKAIVSSGYSNDPVLADHRRYGFAAVLRKPYRINEVVDVLTAVVASPATSA